MEAGEGSGEAGGGFVRDDAGAEQVYEGLPAACGFHEEGAAGLVVVHDAGNVGAGIGAGIGVVGESLDVVGEFGAPLGGDVGWVEGGLAAPSRYCLK